MTSNTELISLMKTVDDIIKKEDVKDKLNEMKDVSQFINYLKEKREVIAELLRIQQSDIEKILLEKAMDTIDQQLLQIVIGSTLHKDDVQSIVDQYEDVKLFDGDPKFGFAKATPINKDGVHRVNIDRFTF